MVKNKSDSTAATELRHRAEELLRAKTAETPPNRTDDESQRLSHELEVHQIELEMQNAELRKSRDEVEATLERYIDLYDFAPVGYFTLDREGVIHAANLTGASILRSERSLLPGRRFDSFLSPEVRLNFIPFLEKVFSSMGKEKCEVPLMKDGKRPLHLQIEAMASASVTECRLAVIDISDRWKAEKDLQESEIRYASIFNNRHVVKILIDPETGKILKANPAACSFYGYSSEQFSALSIFDINNLPRHDILKKMEQALKMDGSPFHFRHCLANGEIRDVEVYSCPIVINEQKLLYSIVHDITERKRMEEKLRKREHQLAEAQTLAHIGSWEWDSIADAITGSGEFNRIFGMVLSTYDSFLELVHPDDRETVTKAVRETLAQKAPYNVHYRIIRPDGITRVIHAQGAAVTDGAGKPLRMIGTAQDVTGRREMEEKLEIMHSELAAHASQLEAANKELEAFNYMVAHDLRTPLSSINGFCQVIQKLFAGQNEEFKEYLQEIYEASLRMDRLIGALLVFSRVTRVKIRNEKVALGKIALEVAMGLKMSEPEHRVTFRISEGIVINGDASLLRIVIDNLLGNAWKYSGKREEAVIEFGVSETAREQIFFVRDNGTGFDNAYAEKLFIPFQRLPGSNEFKGHGIGLATVERIIRRHGGRVWAEGELGKGATFYFTLAADGDSS
jgi:PAS domain S-box-containing protein